MRIFKNIYFNAIKNNRKTFINNFNRKMDEVAQAQVKNKTNFNFYYLNLFSIQ